MNKSDYVDHVILYAVDDAVGRLEDLPVPTVPLGNDAAHHRKGGKPLNGFEKSPHESDCVIGGSHAR